MRGGGWDVALPRRNQKLILEPRYCIYNAEGLVHNMLVRHANRETGTGMGTAHAAHLPISHHFCVPSNWDQPELRRLELLYNLFVKKDTVMMYFVEQINDERHLHNGEQFLAAVKKARANSALRYEVTQLRRRNAELEREVAELKQSAVRAQLLPLSGSAAHFVQPRTL